MTREHLVGGGGQAFDVVLVGPEDQVFAGGEVAVERSGADAGALGDLAQRHERVLREQLVSGLDDRDTVARGGLALRAVGARRLVGHAPMMPHALTPGQSSASFGSTCGGSSAC